MEPTKSAAERAAQTEPARRARKQKAAERYINRMLESAPPLTPAQLDHLAGLFRKGGQR